MLKLHCLSVTEMRSLSQTRLYFQRTSAHRWPELLALLWQQSGRPFSSLSTAVCCKIPQPSSLACRIFPQGTQQRLWGPSHASCAISSNRSCACPSQNAGCCHNKTLQTNDGNLAVSTCRCFYGNNKQIQASSLLPWLKLMILSQKPTLQYCLICRPSCACLAS